MKKAAVLMLLLLGLVFAFAFSAQAEGWICSYCGCINEDYFCSRCGRGAGPGPAVFTANIYTAVYNVSTEQLVRRCSSPQDRPGAGQFISFAADVSNYGPFDYTFDNAYFRVDDGEKLIWANFSMRAGETARCHIYNVNMEKLRPGIHTVAFYVNDTEVGRRELSLSRNWQALMTYPTQAQINAVSGSGYRSPYIVFYPQFPGIDGIIEYSIDFQIDDMEDGTYFSTMNWDMDVSSLERKYVSLSNDFTSAGTCYCGFQRWDNGKTGVIMSVWDIFCRDKQGNERIICANELYPEVKKGVSKTSGEGSFQQFILEYPWYTGKTYRMLMQMSTSSETGNTVLTMWVCDLETARWTELVAFDLGYKSEYIKTWSLAGFMENYYTSRAGYVRNVSIFNVRGRDYRTGKWNAARSMRFTVNNSMSALDYGGSYNFGSDGSSFWIITSGVKGLCALPPSGSTYSVKYASTEDPY